VPLQSLRQPPAGLASVCGLGQPKELSQHRPCSTWNSPVTELEDGPTRPLVRRRSLRTWSPRQRGARARPRISPEALACELSGNRLAGYGW